MFFILKQEIVATDAAERIANYNAQGLELYELLRDLKTRADDAVDTIIALSRYINLMETTFLWILILFYKSSLSPPNFIIIIFKLSSILSNCIVNCKQ